MVNPMIITTAVIAGVAGAVALELTVLRPLREGKPILGEQFEHQWHEQMCKMRSGFKKFIDGDDGGESEEETGREDNVVTAETQGFSHRTINNRGKGQVIRRRGQQYQSNAEHHRGGQSPSRRYQAETDDQWHQSIETELQDFEMHERESSLARIKLHDSFRRGMRFGSEFADFDSEPEETERMPWRTGLPERSTQQVQRGSQKHMRTLSDSTNQTAPHHVIGTDSPMLGGNDQLRPHEADRATPLSQAASESQKESTISLIDVSPSTSQNIGSQADARSSSLGSGTVDTPAEQASVASSESSDFEFISPPVSSWGAEDEERGAGLGYEEDFALSPRLSDTDIAGWSRPHSPLSAHAQNASEASSLIWDAEEGGERTIKDSFETATSGLTIREGSNQDAVVRPTSPGQRSDDSWAHLSDDIHHL